MIKGKTCSCNYPNFSLLDSIIALLRNSGGVSDVTNGVK